MHNSHHLPHKPLTKQNPRAQPKKDLKITAISGSRNWGIMHNSNSINGRIIWNSKCKNWILQRYQKLYEALIFVWAETPIRSERKRALWNSLVLADLPLFALSLLPLFLSLFFSVRFVFNFFFNLIFTLMSWPLRGVNSWEFQFPEEEKIRFLVSVFWCLFWWWVGVEEIWLLFILFLFLRKKIWMINYGWHLVIKSTDNIFLFLFCEEK